MLEKNINITYKYELEKEKGRQLKKFNTLYQRERDKQEKEINEQTANMIDKSKSIINLSTYSISENIKELLENGMNFSITPAANINRNEKQRKLTPSVQILAQSSARQNRLKETSRENRQHHCSPSNIIKASSF